jgi:uncharacterized membrane-anchored protein
MNRNKWLYFFIGMVAFQWFFPVQMVFQKQITISSGNEFLFKIIPVDPIDPLRGRYLALSFEQNTFHLKGQKFYSPPKPLFAEIVTDQEGFAKVAKLHFDFAPKNTADYVSISEYYTSLENGNTSTLHYTFPFSRYYVNEKEAPKLEKEYFEALRDSSKTCFARVFIKDGHAVLKGIEID